MNTIDTLKGAGTIVLIGLMGVLATPLVAEAQLSERDQAIIAKWKARNLAMVGVPEYFLSRETP